MNFFDLHDGEYRYVMAKRGDGSVINTYVRTPADLSRFTNLSREKCWDAYIQLNPSRRVAYRPAAKDVTRIQAILIDLDPIEQDADPSGASGELLCGIWDIHEGNYHLVDSGRGVQIWLELDPPLDPRYQPRVKEFIRWLSAQFGRIKGCIIDTHTSDACRLARLPGSIHTATRKEVTVIWGSLCPSAFLFRPVFEPTPYSPVSASAGRTWPLISPFTTLATREFVECGVDSPGRHTRAWHVAQNLRELGVDPGVTWKVLQRGNKKCRPRPLGQPDLRRILRQAFPT